MEKFLPEDIMLDIFSRVPFESVFECRLVSKTWKYFTSLLSKVNSPSSDSKVGFICLNTSQNLSFQLLYLEYDDDETNQQRQLRISKMNHPLIRTKQCELMERVPPRTPYSKVKSVIIGSSNGLICLSTISTEVKFGSLLDPLYICNPITREYISLPICSEECLEGRNVFGFGYTDKTDEYKVVRIFYESEERTEPGQIQVYTLGAGTGWRNRGDVAYRSPVLENGMNADGEVYWLDQDTLKKQRVYDEPNLGRIMAFNLSDEVFRLLPETPYYTTLSSGQKLVVYPYGHSIEVLEGCLCYIQKQGSDTGNIWSFKKNNDTSGFNEKEEDSSNWSLAGNVRIKPSCLVQFFDLTKSGEVLCWYDRKTAFRYDPRTVNTKILLNDDDTAYLKVFETIRHKSSFISLKVLGEENVKMFDLIN